jgi:hypothetical protein
MIEKAQVLEAQRGARIGPTEHTCLLAGQYASKE